MNLSVQRAKLAGMITSLTIRDFRNHKKTVLRFGKLTAIAGPNGVGKSNALDGLFDFSEESLKNQKEKNSTANTEKLLELECSVAEFKGKSDSRDFYKYNLCKNFRCGEIEHEPKPNQKASSIHSASKLQSISMLYIKPLAEGLSPSYSEEVTPRIERDGRGLASVLTYMMTSSPIDFAKLKNSLQSIVPQILNIRSTREKVLRVKKKSVTIDGREIVYDEPDEVIGDSLRFDTKTASDLEAFQLSDGTLLVLVILTVLFQSKDADVILIDDIENGLHPKAQEDVVNCLRKIVDEREDLQIVFTTHSPYILNQLEAGEINILTSDENGYCKAKLLSEHPKAKEALKVLSTGELWSAEGEEWVGEKLAS